MFLNFLSGKLQVGDLNNLSSTSTSQSLGTTQSTTLSFLSPTVQSSSTYAISPSFFTPPSNDSTSSSTSSYTTTTTSISDSSNSSASPEQSSQSSSSYQSFSSTMTTPVRVPQKPLPIPHRTLLRLSSPSASTHTPHLPNDTNTQFQSLQSDTPYESSAEANDDHPQNSHWMMFTPRSKKMIHYLPFQERLAIATHSVTGDTSLYNLHQNESSKRKQIRRFNGQRSVTGCLHKITSHCSRDLLIGIIAGTGLTTVATLLAIFLNKVNFVFDLIGATAGVVVGFLFPAFLYLRVTSNPQRYIRVLERRYFEEDDLSPEEEESLKEKMISLLSPHPVVTPSCTCAVLCIIITGVIGLFAFAMAIMYDTPLKHYIDP